ncbi:MAG: GatB/YqeY domain-containing protein [Chloroflexi bacterium]|nr:GatB/YqeY domain-containing protein [Chloroflexota bacterium]
MQAQGGLQERLMQSLHDAVRNRDEIRRSVLRLTLAAIHNAEIDHRGPLGEGGIQEVISREVKKRRESIEAFRKGNRPDLVAREEAELLILEEWMPAQLSREEIVRLAHQAAQEAGARGPRDKGRVMGKLMPQVKGRSEGQVVSQVVDEVLASLS